MSKQILSVSRNILRQWASVAKRKATHLALVGAALAAVAAPPLSAVLVTSAPLPARAEGFAGPNNIVLARCVGASGGVSYISNNVFSDAQCKDLVRQELGPNAGYGYYPNQTRIVGHWRMLGR